MRPRFHLAIPVTDLPRTRAFYTELLDCGVGRESDRWIDFDLAGHQVTAPRRRRGVRSRDEPRRRSRRARAPLRRDPRRAAWDALAARLRAAAGDFLIEPHVRFEGSAGEQRTLFLLDPSGNGLEFKAFADDEQVFARD